VGLKIDSGLEQTHSRETTGLEKAAWMQAWGLCAAETQGKPFADSESVRIGVAK